MRETTLCDYAANEIAQLRAKGCAVSDSDIVEINALAWDVVNKGRFTERLARGRPVACGKAWLWPLTLAASDWFDSIGCDIGDGRAALGYAMAHGENDDLLTVSEKQVKAWFRQLQCTPEQFDVAVHSIMEQGEEPDLTRPTDEPKPAGNMTAGRLSAIMVARCGGTVEQWERRVSVDYIRSVLEVLTEQDAADGAGVMDYHTRKANDALDACICRIEGRIKNG